MLQDFNHVLCGYDIIVRLGCEVEIFEICKALLHGTQNPIHSFSTKRTCAVQKLFKINFFRAQIQRQQQPLLSGKEIHQNSIDSFCYRSIITKVTKRNFISKETIDSDTILQWTQGGNC